MKINIYYGGRGVIDDPTIYVLSQIEQVLGELRVEVVRYNIYEYKNQIATLPVTLKDADGIILATTVEWLGIGGFMAQFLDACWFYGDKDKIAGIYMQPVVISTTYGEKEAVLNLENAWQMLGGQLCNGLCGYVQGIAQLKENPDYHRVIEKMSENLYRAISQRTKNLPASNQAVRKTVLRTQTMELTPQESEQLSAFASDEDYVKQQKEDIIQLSSFYRNLLGGQQEEWDNEYINAFQSHFKGVEGYKGEYVLVINGHKDPLVISVDADQLQISYKPQSEGDVIAHTSDSVMNAITSGRMTFQKAFNTGQMTAQGSFANFRMLDEIFTF
ncbi:MAG: SCP2 sterol-binding domain-containing protein [Lachnospiraceae bacterium]|nr:SCP2 sterol-binding domain-containing protein [Lachnospiraceae bacterium]